MISLACSDRLLHWAQAKRVRERERDCESLSYVVCVSKYVGTVVLLYDFYPFPPDSCTLCIVCYLVVLCTYLCACWETYRWSKSRSLGCMLGDAHATYTIEVYCLWCGWYVLLWKTRNVLLFDYWWCVLTLLLWVVLQWLLLVCMATLCCVGQIMVYVVSDV